MEFLAFVLGMAMLIYLLVFVFSRKRGVKARHAPRRQPLDHSFIAARWADIEQMAHTHGRGKSAVMEADSLLDHCLKASGARGETMADRLRDSQKRFKNVDSVWRAHKLRNQFAHEMGFEAPQSQIQDAIRSFELALRDIGGLL